MAPDKTIRIAIAGDITHPDVRDLIRGVGAYVRRHADWEVRVAESPLESVLTLGSAAHGRTRNMAGVLADFDDPRIAKSLQGLKKPIVAFGGDGDTGDLPGTIPYVYSDNEAIGRMGADHLVKAGYRHFAFCGFHKTRVTGWSGPRADAFRARLVVRASSDITLTPEPVVTETLRFIRQNAGFEVDVAAVAARTDLTRATLDNRFKRLVGHTVQAEIERARVARIRTLLARAELSIKEVSYEAGFRHASYLTAFFNKRLNRALPNTGKHSWPATGKKIRAVARFAFGEKWWR